MIPSLYSINQGIKVTHLGCVTREALLANLKYKRCLVMPDDARFNSAFINQYLGEKLKSDALRCLVMPLVLFGFVAAQRASSRNDALQPYLHHGDFLTRTNSYKGLLAITDCCDAQPAAFLPWRQHLKPRLIAPFSRILRARRGKNRGKQGSTLRQSIGYGFTYIKTGTVAGLFAAAQGIPPHPGLCFSSHQNFLKPMGGVGAGVPRRCDSHSGIDAIWSAIKSLAPENFYLRGEKSIPACNPHGTEKLFNLGESSYEKSV